MKEFKKFYDSICDDKELWDNLQNRVDMFSERYPAQNDEERQQIQKRIWARETTLAILERYHLWIHEVDSTES